MSIVAHIIDNEMHLSDEEKALKKSLEEFISQLESLQNELIAKRANLDVTSFDYFSEIRRKIDIQREEYKSKIDEVCLKMISQTSIEEKNYKVKLSKMNLELTEADHFQNTRNLVSLEYRKPTLSHDNVRRLQVEHETRIEQMKSKMRELDSLRNELKAFEFTANTEFIEESFGVLKQNPQQMVSCSQDNKIKIWNMETNECLATLEGHTDQVNCLEMLGNSAFASGSSDCSIRVWDAREFTCIKTLNGHDSRIMCLKSLPSNRLASGSFKEIKIWDLNSGECVKTLKAHSLHVFDMVCTPDGTLVSCSDDMTIVFWDTIQGICTKMLMQTSEVKCLLMLGDVHLACGLMDNTIKIINLESDEPVHSLAGHSSYVWKLIQIESGELISCSDDKSIKIWDLGSQDCIITLEGHTDLVRSVKMARNGELISCSRDGTIKRWDLQSGTCIRSNIGHQGYKIYDMLLI